MDAINTKAINNGHKKTPGFGFVSFANQLEYLKPMIIACPACATHHNLPDDHLAAENSLVKCASCGHSWLEARAIEVIQTAKPVEEEPIHAKNVSDESFCVENLPAEIVTPDTEYEAARIAKAILLVEEKNRIARKQRNKKIRGWAILAACAFLPVAGAAAFPTPVAKLLPGTIPVYEKIGYKINIRGLKFANLSRQYVEANGVKVLAIRGRIINVSGSDNKIPPVRFTLSDKSGKQVYTWVLDNISRKPLKSGQATSFLTRIASPPKLADEIQIRFARASETVMNTSHAGNSNKRPQN